MPNHVTNRITSTWPVIRDYLVEKTSPADTQKEYDNLERKISYSTKVLLASVAQGVWPYDWMLDLVGNADIEAALRKYAPTFEKLVPSPPNKETGDCSSVHAPGEVCWYEWNTDNWGTKWGPYGSYIVFFDADMGEVDAPEEDGYATLIFNTAWSTPTPVWDALIDKMPEYGDDRPPLHIEWADEDFGYNVGEIESTSWYTYWTWHTGGSPAARDLAAIILGPRRRG